MASSSKGQVGMEYLATYGWALFAMFVVIAILAGSGIFNSERFAIEECTIQPNIPCSAYYMYYSSTDRKLHAGITLTNSMGTSALIRNATITITDRGVPINATVDPSRKFVNQGEKTNVTWEISMPAGASPAGSQRKSRITVQFSLCEQYASESDCTDNAPPHSSAGRFDGYVRSAS